MESRTSLVVVQEAGKKNNNQQTQTQTLSEHPSFLPPVHRGLWLPVRKAGCGEKNDAGTYGNQCGNRLGIRVGPQPALTSLSPDRARGAASAGEASPPALSWKRLVRVGCMPQVPECSRPGWKSHVRFRQCRFLFPKPCTRTLTHPCISACLSPLPPQASAHPQLLISPQPYFQLAHPSSDSASHRFLSLAQALPFRPFYIRFQI